MAAEDKNARLKSNMTIAFTRPQTGVGGFGARRPECNKVFMTTSKEGKQALIKRWMDRKRCDREVCLKENGRMEHLFIAAIAALVCTAAVIAGALASQALAGNFSTGDDLYQECSKSGNRGYCLGYAAGLNDALDVLKNSDGTFPRTICIPKGVVVGTVAGIIVRELADHPEIRHHRAGPFAMMALRRAYPCQ